MNNNFYNYKKDLLKKIIEITLSDKIDYRKIKNNLIIIQTILKNRENDEDILEAIDNLILKNLKLLQQKIIIENNEENKNSTIKELNSSFSHKYNNNDISKLYNKMNTYDNNNDLNFLSYRIFAPEDNSINASGVRNF